MPALAACSGPPDTNARVLTVNDSRARYLDALCPLRADSGFWEPAPSSGAAAAATRRLEVAEPVVAQLARPPRPYPRLLRPSMTRLIAVLRGNVAYAQAVRDAPDAAAIAALDPPSPVPVDVIAEVESIVTVSAAPGSGNCTGHLPTTGPTPTPTPSPTSS